MAFSFSRALTINASLCGSANSNNFPVFFAGHASLATVANGGQVQNANGYDIGFYADSALTQKLNWEAVSYTPTTGAGEWHVQIPTLSATTNTTFYVAYGDATVTTDQSNKTAVWDADYRAVWHLNSTTVTDSTKNANNGTVEGTVTTGTGKLGSALAMSGTASSGINVGNSTTLNTGDTLSIETWFSGVSLASGRYGIFSTRTTNAAGSYQLEAGTAYQYTNAVSFTGSGTYVALAPTGTAPNNTWVHVVYTRLAGTSAMYINGAAVSLAGPYSGGGSPTTFTVADNTQNKQIGQGTSGAQIWNGLIDELRLSDSARSASWALASYNNQSAPTTFYSVGTQQTSGLVTAGASAMLFLGW